MATAEHELRPDLLNANTVAASILREARDRRLEPEDNRTRRFGYNPGFLMTQDPVLSGLQLHLIEPGKLILFETSPVSRQKWSVDPEDNTEPNEVKDLLAGDGFHSVDVLYSMMGWREMKALRGLTNERAVDLFYAVHPPLSECVQRGAIPECPYSLSVCITCRQTWLNGIRNPPTSVATLLTELRDSVTVGRNFMAAEWRKWIGEYAATTTTQGQDRPGLRELNDSHLYFMRQLHERTPSEHELAKISLQADRNALIMKETLREMSQQMAEVMRQQQQPTTDPRLMAMMTEQMSVMREQMAAMQAQIKELTSPGEDAEVFPKSPESE